MTTNLPTKKPTLYDLAAEQREIYDILIENDGELTPELEQRLDAVLRQSRDKIDAAAFVLRRLASQASFCDEEAQRLLSRRDSFVRDADRLKARLIPIIDDLYSGKFKSPQTTAWTQDSADTVAFDIAPDADLNQMDEAIVRTRKELDRAELQRRYKAGEEIPHEVKVTPKPGTHYLRIK
jgi:hypothetical protein